ncbi:MAG: MarR family transcriptional regulator [Burkholderiaceae bacterium]
MSLIYDYHAAPGHLIRRAHQLAVSIFAENTVTFDITPVQFAMLNALVDEPGEDQITLAGKVAFDAATSGAVIARLEAKGLLRRDADPKDKRRKLLTATAEGEKVVIAMKAAVADVQGQIMQPLTVKEAAQLTALLGKLVAGHDEISKTGDTT